MTETNINALCSVEAVFDGVDIEVTVEFSAGGGTFEHDELTAESRAKENQHPISAITGLQLALDGKSNVGHVHPKESIAGITILDTPEFADTQITPLAVESTYTPTVWAYLVGIFTTVPKSALQHLIKLWTIIENLKSRIGILEDSYLLKYVVPVNTAAINLTTDKYGNAFNFVEGDKIRVIIKVVLFTASNRVNLRINDRSDNIYLWHSVLDPLNYFPPMISNAFNQYSLTDIELIDNEAIITSAHRYSTTTAGSAVVTGATTGLNSGITSLKLYASSATIPAGAVILIKKR